jgi:DNA-binding SARP family transcriptional activator
MLELHTFGTVGLRSRDVGDSVAALVQPKRLALLVYLALAPRRRCRRRDQVVGLFWPELDGEHARGALNQALRYLRRSLGDEALLSQGEEEVGVDREVIWCDAVAFSTRYDAGEFDQALAVYQGPFLNGFFADASSEFEQWVEEERAGFRSKALVAASSLSQAAEERADPKAALHWAKRAVTTAPDDESAVARLIRLLDQNGDRVGALQTYEALRRRLQNEFDTKPSKETEAIVAAIRSR